MDGLSRLRHGIYGRIVPAIKRRVSSDIDVLVDRLLDDAAGLWAADGWHRFNDAESNCTIQLYRWSREAGRRKAMFGLIDVQMEAVSPTREMLEGNEDAAKMRRPDVRVSIGEIHRKVECKRLSLGNGHPRAYVQEGMHRFVSGVYNSQSGTEYMVGYLQADSIAEVVVAINSHVSSHPAMGPGDVLRAASGSGATSDLFDSNHKRNGRDPFAIRHHILDLT